MWKLGGCGGRKVRKWFSDFSKPSKPANETLPTSHDYKKPAAKP
ncbi:hypothetical protein RRSWK_00879 [Rhodopirellula sp. SWK7]|nr:hypothetical protein RRSWK_00879 [Rhodopirellula sp. SWK7]